MAVTEEVVEAGSTMPVVGWVALGVFLLFIAFRIYKAKTKPKGTGSGGGGGRPGRETEIK